MEILPDFNEKINFDDFDLSWRWDDIHNPSIEKSELGKIIAFSEAESKRLNKVIDYYESEGNLLKSFDETDWILANSETDTNTNRFREAFCELTKDFNENVIISWNRSTCVYTEKNIFIKYWDDFCYPNSDDVTIISESTNWVFFFNHIEVGKFWKRKD